MAAELLACVYACPADSALLDRFHASPVGQWLRERGARVLTVYADPALAEARVDGDLLTVPAEERYDALSVKTQRMVAACVERFDFARLLKIDVTTVLSRLDGPAYEGRSPIDPIVLRDFVRDADPALQYDGLLQHTAAGREGAEGWARKKGGSIDYTRLFGDGPMPPFFSGKCYFLGREFANYVARHGAPVAEEQQRWFMGSEDVMIGRLYRNYRQGVPS